MSINIQKYPTYKPSGVAWLGNIPSHWETIKFKYLFDEINEKSNDGSEELLSVSQYTGVTLKRDKVEEGGMLTNAETLEGYKKVSENDLVSNIMLAWNGSLGFSPFNGITSPAYCIYRLIGNNIPNFFHYLVRTDLYKSEFKRNSSGVIESRLRLYTDDFFRIISILPPLAEQTAIAHYLDRKTAQIDTAIAQKQQMINLLKERRQILIHRAVTQGLDPSVKMKDSGVEWIGEVPVHWEVKKLKYLYSDTFSGGTPSTDILKFWDGEVSWVSSADVKTSFLTKTIRNITELGLKRSSSNIGKKGSIIIVTRSGILQHTLPIAILMKDMAVNQDIKCFILKENLISPNYLLNYIQGNNNEILVETRKQGATVESIEMADFVNLTIPLPPLDEQTQILTFIQEFSQKIEKAIHLKAQEIETLKEYKGSLINSVVTGKVKVVNE